MGSLGFEPRIANVLYVLYVPQAGILNQARRRPHSTILRPNCENLIINTLIKLKSEGLAENTLRTTSYKLTYLNKICDLTKPEDVKLQISNLKVANSYKQSLTNAYNYFANINQIEWKRPHYKTERKIPNIPTRENIMKIISTAKKYAAIFKTLMETGIMPHELAKTEQKDINLETRIMNVTGYKGHASRTFKLTQETTAMLKQYFYKYTKFPESIWIQKMWRKHRNKLAEKLQDPAIHNIRLYDLRHYYATMLYAKTRDILLVKQQLGHKKIETTMIYTQLINFNENEDYTCKTATTPKESAELIEHGFEYITGTFEDGGKQFRKRK